MHSQRKVKVSLDKALAERLGLQQEWILGRILPGQREGAAQKVPRVEAEASSHVILLAHVDDMILGGEEPRKWQESLTTSMKR